MVNGVWLRGGSGTLRIRLVQFGSVVAQGGGGVVVVAAVVVVRAPWLLVTRAGTLRARPAL